MKTIQQTFIISALTILSISNAEAKSTNNSSFTTNIDSILKVIR